MIRRATDEDRTTILDLHRAAFGGDDVPRLVEELWASEWYEPELAFVADDDARVAGHASCSRRSARVASRSCSSRGARATTAASASCGPMSSALLPPPEALYDWAFQVAVLDETPLPQGRVVYTPPFCH